MDRLLADIRSGLAVRRSRESAVVKVMMMSFHLSTVFFMAWVALKTQFHLDRRTYESSSNLSPNIYSNNFNVLPLFSYKPNFGKIHKVLLHVLFFVPEYPVCKAAPSLRMSHGLVHRSVLEFLKLKDPFSLK